MTFEAYERERIRRTRPVGIAAVILVILGLVALFLEHPIWGGLILLAALFCASIFLCLRTKGDGAGCFWALVGVSSLLAIIVLGAWAALEKFI